MLRESKMLAPPSFTRNPDCPWCKGCMRIRVIDPDNVQFKDKLEMLFMREPGLPIYFSALCHICAPDKHNLLNIMEHIAKKYPEDYLVVLVTHLYIDLLSEHTPKDAHILIETLGLDVGVNQEIIERYEQRSAELLKKLGRSTRTVIQNTTDKMRMKQ